MEWELLLNKIGKAQNSELRPIMDRVLNGDFSGPDYPAGGLQHGHNGIILGRFFNLWMNGRARLDYQFITDEEENRNFLRITTSVPSSPAENDYYLLQHTINPIMIHDLNWGEDDARPLEFSTVIRASEAITLAVAVRTSDFQWSYVSPLKIEGQNWQKITCIIPGLKSKSFYNNSGLLLSIVIGGGKKYLTQPYQWFTGERFLLEAASLNTSKSVTIDIAEISAIAQIAANHEDKVKAFRAQQNLMTFFKCELDESGAITLDNFKKLQEFLLEKINSEDSGNKHQRVCFVYENGDNSYLLKRQPENSTQRFQSFNDLDFLVSSSDLIFFLNEGDEVDSRSMEIFLRSKYKELEFGTFDFFEIVADKAKLTLAPGFNPPYLTALKLYSRFFIRGSYLSLIKSCKNVEEAFFSLVLKNEMKKTCFNHFPVPLIQTCKNSDYKVTDGSKLRNSRSTHKIKDFNNNVSVVILTKDKAHLVSSLITSIRNNDYISEIVIVSNNTENREAQAILNSLSELPKVRLIVDNRPFNFSSLCNLGADAAVGDLVLFLNDDVIPIGSNWLEELIYSINENPMNAAAGPLLLYPNSTVQHGGMFTGFNSCAGHTLRGASLPDGDKFSLLSAPRRVSCITGATFLIKTKVFRNLNGFDINLGSYLQDVDLSLRLVESGNNIIFNPRSVLFHFESASVRETLNEVEMGRRGLEHQYFMSRWSRVLYSDKYHPKLLGFNNEGLDFLSVEKI
jgi:GT2 family glycosyltransferase